MLKKWTCKEKKWSRFFLWLMIGFLVGTVFASLFFFTGKEAFLNMEVKMWNIVKSMKTIEIGYIVNELIMQGKEILILCMIVMSSWYEILLFLFWFRKGFLFGIFMGMFAKCHGFYGVLLGVCYIFPKEYVYMLLEFVVVTILLNGKQIGIGKKKIHMFTKIVRAVIFVIGILVTLIVGVLGELVIGFKILSQLN